jgi:hypothetical protein
MNFSCNNNSVQGCCSPAPQPMVSPSVECLKVLSVIGTQSVQKVAELAVPTAVLFPGVVLTPEQLALITFTNVTADPNGIVMRGTLIEGKVINSGFVPVTANISILGIIDVPIPVNLNLPFQAETEFPGACPGDDLQETVPVIEAVLTPVVTPAVSIAGVLALGLITFKVIIRTQITVSRERLVQAGVNVIGDINQDRCTTLQPTTPTARTVTFFNGG